MNNKEKHLPYNHRMAFSHKRQEREQQTLNCMIALYCRKKHNTQSGLCDACQELQDYASQRLRQCPFQQGKTTCARCAVHCYREDMRARIRQVMRFSGPRMLLRAPLLTILHGLDGLRDKPRTSS